MVVVAVAFAALDDLELLQQHASKCVRHANVAQFETCLQRIEATTPKIFFCNGNEQSCSEWKGCGKQCAWMWQRAKEGGEEVIMTSQERFEPAPEKTFGGAILEPKLPNDGSIYGFWIKSVLVKFIRRHTLVDSVTLSQRRESRTTQPSTNPFFKAKFWLHCKLLKFQGANSATKG
jgi:hypothetical protein